MPLNIASLSIALPPCVMTIFAILANSSSVGMYFGLSTYFNTVSNA